MSDFYAKKPQIHEKATVDTNIYSFNFNLSTHPVGRTYLNFHIKIDRLIRPRGLGKWDFFRFIADFWNRVD
jgi:hypothetical protein